MQKIYLNIARFAVLIFLMLHVGVAHADNPGYWIQDGNHLTQVAQGDASQVTAEEWQIWLFKKAQSASGSKYWGALTGKTVESVNRQLKMWQNFEKSYVKWSGGDFGAETYFNPLGPIAIVHSSQPKKLAALDATQNALSKMQILYGGYNKIMQIIATAPKDENPFKNVGVVLKEYLNNFKHTQQQLAKLKKALLVGDIAQSEFSASLASLSQEMHVTEQQGSALAKTATKTASAQPHTAPDPIALWSQTWMSQATYGYDTTYDIGTHYQTHFHVTKSALIIDTVSIPTREWKQDERIATIPFTSLETVEVFPPNPASDYSHNQTRVYAMQLRAHDNSNFPFHIAKGGETLDDTTPLASALFSNEFDAVEAMRVIKALMDPTTRADALQHLGVK